METDLEYFRRRASEEYLSYANAEHPEARRAHLALAKRYEDLAGAIDKANAASEKDTAGRLTMWL
jgi:hypothetical protein